MKFSTVPSLEKRKKTDILVLPFWKNEKKIEPARSLGKLSSEIVLPVYLEDFSGKEGETFLSYTDLPEKRVVFLGLGERKKASVENLRRAYGALVKTLLKKRIESISLLIPETDTLDEEYCLLGISEGILLSNYAFEKLKGIDFKDAVSLIQNVVFIGASAKGLKKAQEAAIIAEGVYLARDLINDNADEITPQFLSRKAQEIAHENPHIKATIFDKKRIEKEKMGLLLAVNRGSNLEPAFIILEYKGNPKNKDHTIIVGKGLTYDTGGLSLKPTLSMLDMKCDMSGAAVALGTIYAASKLGIKKNITALIPSTENSIGSKSYKPGDIYTSYAGKTVEIGNTDAEGRLILADALAYAVKNLKPTRMIDFATLTGAIVVALGEEASGLMTNSDALAEGLKKAGELTYERVWRLPLFEEYKQQLDSDFADLNNVGGKEASSITAALFLQAFVGETPWAHLDIAGTAYLSKARRYHPKYGTGIGVRLMIEYLKQLDQ